MVELQFVLMIMSLLTLSVAMGVAVAILVPPQRNRLNFLFAIGCLVIWVRASDVLLATMPWLEQTLGGLQIFSSSLNLVLILVFGLVIHEFWIQFDAKGMWRRRLLALMLVVGLSALCDLSTETLLLIIARLADVGLLISLGVALGQQQIFNPFEKLNKELRVTNQIFQSAIDDLAREKNRVDMLNHELTASSRYKSEFMANMSHELRTPLNSIVGYSELLRSNLYGALNEKQADRLERIYRNSQHLSRLIDAILDITKIDSGSLKLDRVSFNFSSVAHIVSDEFKPQALTKGLRLEVHLAEDLPFLWADQQRVYQIMHHLTSNAVKFTQRGTIVITAELLEGERASAYGLDTKAWLFIQVKDTGIGISESYIPSLFEEFSQAETGHTRQFDGLGLGLVMTKRLVEQHHGKIWVESALGVGSTFYVVLPIETPPTLSESSG